MANTIAPTGGWLAMLYIDGSSAIAGELSSSVSITRNLIDANSKSNTSWNEFVSGRAGGTISFSGIEDTGDAGQAIVYTKVFDGTETALEWKTFNATKQYSGGAFINDFSHESSHDGLVMISCGLTFNGAINYEATA